MLSRSIPDKTKVAYDDAVTMAITSEDESSEEESSDNEDVDSHVSKNLILRNGNAACKGKL